MTLIWLLYYIYGDESILEKNYSSVSILADLYLTQWPDQVADPIFGDWCAPNRPANYATSFSSTQETEIAFLHQQFDIAAKIAEILGKTEDSTRFANAAKGACTAYNKLFWDKDKGVYSCGKQTPNILALVEGIPDAGSKESVINGLVDSFIASGCHLDTGIFGTRYLLDVLSDAGHTDLALKSLMHDEYPGFGYQIARGATTMWEQWFEKGDMVTHNHAMFAGAVTGFFSRLAGITPAEAGYGRIRIEPRLSGFITELECRINTVRGPIFVKWKCAEDRFRLETVIPANCNAEIILPDRTKHEIGNGIYHFESELDPYFLRGNDDVETIA